MAAVMGRERTAAMRSSVASSLRSMSSAATSHARVDDAADEARDLVAVEVELLRGERRAQERADLVADVGVVELSPRLEGGVELVVDFYADGFGFVHRVSS